MGGPNTMQQSPPVVEKMLSTAPSKILSIVSSPVGAWINTEKQCRVDSLFANVKVCPLPQSRGHNNVHDATHHCTKGCPCFAQKEPVNFVQLHLSHSSGP